MPQFLSSKLRPPLTGTGRSSDSHRGQAQVPTLPWLGHSPVPPDPQVLSERNTDTSVSHKKGTQDRHLVLKHRLLITCIKHTFAQQRCVTGYNS